ncbi:MarR family transcriptional regulator [Streptomyces sp. x-19]|uniref:MarR family transcriptional regulator n=1 Tax=Streptomyces sp. x-19 TaxID=2789280 RepID=UPI00398101A1
MRFWAGVLTENPGPQETAATAQRLNDAIKRLRARLRTESGQHATGPSATRLGVLASVVREGPVTAARLAAAEHASAQAVAQSLAALKAAGLVHSQPGPKDGRKKLMWAHR